jgi:hypothetical protein
MSTASHLRGITAAAVAALIASVFPTSVGAASSATTASNPYAGARQAAADWQGDQLQEKGQIPNGAGGTDWGVTIDTMFQLASDGTQPIRQARTKLALERNAVARYATTGRDTFAGPMSKTLLVSEVMRDNPTNFNGVNLRRRVLALVASRGFQSGRVKDHIGGGDSSNVFSQVYAIVGLARSGGVPQNVVNFLLKQQCSAGYFRLLETATTTCDQDHSPTDVDATAFAIQAINAARGIGGATVPVSRFDKAVAWLMAQQKADGSFGGGVGSRGANSNSTGLAAQAFGSAHRFTSLNRAQHWMVGLQITRRKAGSGPARNQIGAIAYDKASLASALKHGLGPVTIGQFRRATPQAALAFAPIPLAKLVLPPLGRAR